MARSLVLFEDAGFRDLLPLTLWRSIFELRVGRKILLDRIAQTLEMPVSGIWTRDWMASVAAQRCGAPANRPAEACTILVNGRWRPHERVEFPDHPCVALIDGEIAFAVCDDALASRLSPSAMLDCGQWKEAVKGVEPITAPGRLIRYAWEAIAELRSSLIRDWLPSDAGLESECSNQQVVGGVEGLHIGLGTFVHPTASLDTTHGPIFMSHDVSVGAGAVIEGPAYIGPGGRVNPHSWLHGGVAAGPVCKLGGEVDGCIFDGYSNKQHGGFLGHCYVGSWVNIGAGANNSDLKNTYGSVRVTVHGDTIDTGLTFFGAVIADHVKVGINASIPTGAWIGMGAQVATTRLIPKVLPSFAWITDETQIRGDCARLLDVATRVMARRGVVMTDEEVELFLGLDSRALELESNHATRVP